MNRRKLTPEEMAAKVEKMKATKAANKAKALEAVSETLSNQESGLKVSATPLLQ